MSNYPKRLIEVDLPIRAISEHARKDQNIRKGHLHTMHVWWAAKPLASCRAVVMATLLPDAADPNCPGAFVRQARELMLRWATRHGHKAGSQGQDRVIRIRNKPDILNDPAELRIALLDFIADFAAWEAGIDPDYLATARALITAAHPDGSPLVLDPFAGAGSIPFEALRVGAQAFAGDLNPVAVLINKVALEYLPRYGRRLAEGVEKWGKWVLEEARKRLAPYYPADSKGNIPLACIWARTIQCEGPGCGAEVPLLWALWLSRKSKNLIALRYRGVKAEGKRQKPEVIVDLFQPKSAAEVQPPIVNRMSATCPCCGYTTPYKSVREQLRKKRGGTMDARMVAVITLDKHGGRHFRLPEEADLKAAEKARRELDRVVRVHTGPWPFVPNEPTPPDGTLGYRINKYGMEQWSDVYLPRQALALGTLCCLVGEAREQMLKEGNDRGFADGVATCIGLAVTNTAPMLCACSYYGQDHFRTVFQGSGLPIKPDFAEANPLMPKLVGGVEFALSLVFAILAREGLVIRDAGTVGRNSATTLPLPDEAVAYVVTDPPYYDAVPYAALSDFCYVWLKRAVGKIYPDLFATELTPKAEECILDPGPPVEGGVSKDRNYFEATMQAALADARRTLKPDGVGVVIFAHKGTAGWEALLNALVNAGWTVTASWPIDTERAARMRAKDSATLASSVHLVCRPRDDSMAAAIGDWREVLGELPGRIRQWMARLADEGVVGADAIFACLGPALEIFSRYGKVEKANGQQVTLREYLEQVWAAVSNEALEQVFKGANTSGFEEDARLTAMWLWTLSAGRNGNGMKTAEPDDSGEGDENDEEESGSRKKARVSGYMLEYDAARKIAQGLGAHLENLTSLVEVKGETARLLPVAERTRYLFGKDEAQAPTGKRKKTDKQQTFDFAKEVEKVEAEAGGWGEKAKPRAGNTVLDQLHQSMILFAAGRSEAMKRFLVEDGIGQDGRFWTLAQALSALYPAGSDEKRWVDGVLARKKSLGF